MLSSQFILYYHVLVWQERQEVLNSQLTWLISQIIQGLNTLDSMYEEALTDITASLKQIIDGKCV